MVIKYFLVPNIFRKFIPKISKIQSFGLPPQSVKFRFQNFVLCTPGYSENSAVLNMAAFIQFHGSYGAAAFGWWNGWSAGHVTAQSVRYWLGATILKGPAIGKTLGITPLGWGLWALSLNYVIVNICNLLFCSPPPHHVPVAYITCMVIDWE